MREQRDPGLCSASWLPLWLLLPIAAALALTTAAMAQAPLTPERERALNAGEVFKECAHCPEMVVVPAGRFTMGSPASEAGHDDDEEPQHAVTFGSPFAVGRFAVTFEEWDACADAGGCNGYRPGDEGLGRGRQPVINVSWDDAKRYAAWLSRTTGKTYRLVSDAEYEYATRAGTKTAFYWGQEIGKGNANCRTCGSQWDNKQPAPVGSLRPNAFGLYEMVGNVEQWIADCWHDNYQGAPSDGTVWKGGACGRPVVRAGSYIGFPEYMRSAYRSWAPADLQDNIIGFRIGRTLLSDAASQTDKTGGE